MPLRARALISWKIPNRPPQPRLRRPRSNVNQREGRTDRRTRTDLFASPPSGIIFPVVSERGRIEVQKELTHTVTRDGFQKHRRTNHEPCLVAPQTSMEYVSHSIWSCESVLECSTLSYAFMSAHHLAEQHKMKEKRHAKKGLCFCRTRRTEREILQF